MCTAQLNRLVHGILRKHVLTDISETLSKKDGIELTVKNELKVTGN
jgi:hypothetical protein